MKMTKTDAVFKHRVLWCAMADYIEKGIIKDTVAELKYEVLKERFPAYALNLDYNCFLCTYALDCKRCPLQDITQSDCLKGLYRKFDYVVYRMAGRELGYFPEAVKTVAVKIALKIAFLPVIN